LKPDPPLVLNGIVAEFARHVAPELRTPYAQGVFGLGVTMLTMLAQEYDRAAARLVEENDAIAALLEDISYVVEDTMLRDRIGAELQTPRHTNLRVSALEPENDRLRLLLIEAHAAVEGLDSPEARVLNERVWAELQESTRRRHVASRLA
jgi:hypothetical protein